MKKILLIAVMATAYQVGAQIPTDNLQAHYPFNGNANDNTINSNNGIISGATLTNDRFGNSNSAYSFDGVDDRIVIPQDTSLNFDGQTDDYSFSIWVKSATPKLGANSFRIVEKWIGGSGYPISISSNNVIGDYNVNIWVYDGTTLSAHSCGDSMWAGNWNHLVFIVDNSLGELRCYVNGVLQGATPFNLAASGASTGDIVFGNSHSFIRPYFGTMDDIRIYGDVLTECEIWSLFKEGIGVFDLSVTQTGNTLTSNQNNVSYQWVDCSNSFSIIAGDTNQVFTASTNGSYAVILDDGVCSDTSSCYTVTGVGIIEIELGEELLLYPNPTDGRFSIDLGGIYQSVTITLTDLSGKLIRSYKYNDSQLLNLKLEEPVGVYLLSITSGDKKAVIRLLKE